MGLGIALAGLAAIGVATRQSKVQFRAQQCIVEGSCVDCGTGSGSAHHEDCSRVWPFWSVRWKYGRFDYQHNVQTLYPQSAIYSAWKARGFGQPRDLSPSGPMRPAPWIRKGVLRQIWDVDGSSVELRSYPGEAVRK